MHSTPLHQRFTPAPLALAALMAIVQIAGHAPLAHAQGVTTAPITTLSAINIPAQPLGQALNELARQANLQMTFQAELVAGKQAPAVSGQMAARQALARLLTGSGLQVSMEGTSVVVRQAASSTADEALLPAVTVTAAVEARPSELPRPYAGGQVARGGSLGLLGNTDVVNSPFSQSSFTAEFVQNTQAQTLGEALESSPSVRRNGSRFNQSDTYLIRGFNVLSGDDVAYDGFYGLTSFRRNAIEGIERVEVLRGPNALLNGVPTGGSVGGSVNLVPKRPTPQPLTELTLSYAEKSQLGAHLDISRRFGQDQRLGLRVNAAQREGDTRFDFNREKASLASVGLDYLGDRLRLFGHLAYENLRLNAPLLLDLTLAPGLPVPRAPEGSKNFNTPFGFVETERLVGLVRAEYDLNDNWTGSLAFGAQHNDETALASFGQRIINAQGDFSRPTSNRLSLAERRGKAVDAKLRGKFSTGSVKHTLAFGYSGFRADLGTSNAVQPGRGGNSNIYNPNPNAEPLPVFNSVPVTPFRKREFGGLGIADTLDLNNGKVLLTLGARRQQIKVINSGTGVTIYDRSTISPSAALVVKPWDSWSLYGNYIEGLSQGPTAPASAANANEIFPPFVTTQREVGVKHDSGNLLTTLALFEVKQPSQITDAVTRIFSAGGEQRNRGLELESFGEIARGLRFIGGLTLIDAKLTRTQSGTNQGKLATGVPRFATNLSLEWDTPFAPGLTLSGRAIHTDSQFIDQANTLKIPSWTRYDIGARYTVKALNTPMTLRASVTNLFDSNYYESTNLWTGAPRTFAMSATFSF